MASALQYFCQIGLHLSGTTDGNTSEGAVLPSGWRLIPASVNHNGEWFQNPNSKARIPVCPDHQEF